MKSSRVKSGRTRRTAIALAVASALGVIGSAGAEQVFNHLPQARISDQPYLELQGPLLIGPIQEVLMGGTVIKVLGSTIRVNGLLDDALPSQYVAVFGSMSQSGEFVPQRVKRLDEVYAAGSSMVLYTGKSSGVSSPTGHVKIGTAVVDAVAIPDSGEWIASRAGSLFVVLGTQSLDGAPIEPNSLVTFSGSGLLKIENTGLLGIDGSGIFGISGADIAGVGGSGGIEILSPLGIDGSGAQTHRGIDGSGAQTNRGIDGSGAQVDGIDGSGAQTNRGIDGSGAQTNRGIDGSGAQTNRGIDGSGAQADGIDGSGAL
jgi:hypothetical protein